VRHPQTNGSTERLDQTVQNDLYKVALRKKLYKSIEEIQKDLDGFMQYYNEERTNQGKHCQGRTPMQTFQDGRPLYQQYVFENSEEENQAAYNLLQYLNRETNCTSKCYAGHMNG
jgi:hypothetical protein